MAVLTHVGEDEVRTALERFALGPFTAFRGVAAGSVNTNYRVEAGGSAYFLRIYEEQDRTGALSEAELLTHLAHAGLPVACPMRGDDRERLPLFSLKGKPAALFPWRDGEMRCQASVTRQDIFKVGAALARIHVACAPLAAGRGEGRFTLPYLLGRIPTIAAASAEMAGIARGLDNSLREAAGARTRGLPAGVIHGDLFRDNILWDEHGEISALLDFESASRGPWMFDLAVTLLSWCFGSTFEAKLGAALVAGYESVRALSQQEREGLWAEACFASLRFLTTRLTDYELREASGPRVMKDWRRFRMRFEFLEGIGSQGLQALVFA